MADISDWSYIKTRRFTGSSDGTLTNHTEEVVIYFQDGVCEPDFRDIRFVDSEGNFLNYCRRQFVEGSIGLFLVEIPSVPASPNEFYFNILAGNPEAIYTGVNVANGFFVENFEGSSLDTGKWISDNKILYRLIDNEIQIYDVLWEDVYDANVGKQIRANFSLPSKFKVKYTIRQTEINGGRTSYTGIGITNPDNVHFASGFIRNQEGPANKYYNSIWPDYTYDINANAGDIFEMEIRRLGSNKTLIYRNGTKIVERTDNYVNNKLVIHGMRNWTHPDFVGIRDLYLVSTTENPPNLEEETEWEFIHTTKDFKTIFGITSIKDIKLLFCIRPSRTDFKLITSIRGWGVKDIRTLLNIRSVFRKDLLDNFRLIYTITPLENIEEKRLVFYITGNMIISLPVSGLISYDILGLPDEDENLNSEEGEVIETNLDEDDNFVVIIGDTTYV